MPESCFGVPPAPRPAGPSLNVLGGNARLDPVEALLKFTGNGNPIKKSSELYCDEWRQPPCRWRNEPNGVGRDNLDWARGLGQWDPRNGHTIFGTNALPTEPWLVVGTAEKLAPTDSAMLISDPIACQDGDAIVSMEYWTSPRTHLRVCTRIIGRAELGYCSEKIAGDSPGPADVIVPGPISEAFELVIQAQGFDFDDFGLRGGIVIIDRLDYLYPWIQVENCRGSSTEDNDREACRVISCDFSGGGCTTNLEKQDWQAVEGPTGIRHTGIHESPGPYALAQGPADQMVYKTGSFGLKKDNMLEFCYYRASANSHLMVNAIKSRGREEQLFKTSDINTMDDHHQWVCDHVLLEEGIYKSIEFVAENLKTRHNYIGLDEIKLLDGTNRLARPLC